MLALLAAAALSAAPQATAAEPVLLPKPNVYQLPEHCRAYQRTQRAVPPEPIPFSDFKLGKQPPADMHLLVDRRVGGCPVPTIVRYNVEEPRPVAPRREGAPARRR